MRNIQDTIVIGSGPAGISAALYTVRAGLDTLVIGERDSTLMKAEAIGNYYGFPQPVSGQKLLQDGIGQARNTGAAVAEDQVVSIGFDTEFTVKTKEQTYRSRSVILATGANRTAPKIKGFSDFEGKGISYCAMCDAFFYRGKDVAVLGCCDYALHESMELLAIAKSVVLLTNGTEPISDFPKQIRIIKQQIEAFTGTDALEHVRFIDGSEIAVQGVFVAIGVAGSADLAKKVGAQTEGLRIVVDANMATSVPGLFAAGDCIGGMMQVVKAAYEGAKAGTEAVKYVRKLKSAAVQE